MIAIEQALKEIKYAFDERDRELISSILDLIREKAIALSSLGLTVKDSPIICQPEVYNTQEKGKEAVRKRLTRLFKDFPEQGLSIKIASGDSIVTVYFQRKSGFYRAEIEGKIVYLSEDDAEENRNKVKIAKQRAIGIVAEIIIQPERGSEVKHNILKLLVLAYRCNLGAYVDRVLNFVKSLFTGELTERDLEDFLNFANNLIKQASAFLCLNGWMGYNISSPNANGQVRYNTPLQQSNII